MMKIEPLAGARVSPPPPVRMPCQPSTHCSVMYSPRVGLAWGAPQSSRPHHHHELSARFLVALEAGGARRTAGTTAGGRPVTSCRMFAVIGRSARAEKFAEAFADALSAPRGRAASTAGGFGCARGGGRRGDEERFDIREMGGGRQLHVPAALVREVDETAEERRGAER